MYIYIYIYTYNPIYQELIDEDDYFNSRSNERIYLDLMASSGYTSESKKLERNDSKINLHLLLSSRKKKAKSKSLGAFSRWNLHILSRSALTLRHQTYTINQDDEDFLEWQGKNNL